MKAQDKVRLAHHGLRLDTPAPRVQEMRKYPTRAQMRQELHRLPKSLPATAYTEDLYEDEIALLRHVFEDE